MIVKTAFLLSKAAFAIAVLCLISHYVLYLSKYFKYSTYSCCLLFTIICFCDGYVGIVLALDFS